MSANTDIIGHWEISEVYLGLKKRQRIFSHLHLLTHICCRADAGNLPGAAGDERAVAGVRAPRVPGQRAQGQAGQVSLLQHPRHSGTHQPLTLAP